MLDENNASDKSLKHLEFNIHLIEKIDFKTEKQDKNGHKYTVE